MDLDQSNIPNQINQQHNINNNTNNNNNQNSSLSLPPIGDQAAAAIAAAQNNNNNNNNNPNPNPATFAAPFPTGTMQVPANITASIFQNGIPNNNIINNNNTNTISPNNQNNNSNNNNNNNSSGNSEEEEEDIDIQMNGINGTNSINGNNGSSNPTSSFQNDTDMTQTSNNSSNTSNSSNTETNEQSINDGANSNGSNSSNSSNSSDEGDGDPNDGDYDNTEDLNNNIDDDDEDDDIDIKPKEKSRSGGSKSKSKSKTKSKSKSKSKSLGSSKSKNKENNNNNDNNSNNSSNSNNNNKEKDKSLYQDKIIFSSSDFDQIYNIEIDSTIASSLSYPMEQCYKLVTFIKEQRACGVFCEKVDEDYLKRYNIEQYKNTVRFPMDFVTITDYLENDEYENIFDFAEDCRLVFANAKKFNKPGSDIYEGAESLNQLFNKKFIQLRHHLKIYYDNKNTTKNSSNGHNGMEVDNDDDIGRKQCSEKYKYDARYRLRYGGAGDDKFHKRIDWDNEENARKFRDCRDSKTIVQKREVYRDKESSHTNRKKFSILFNELGRIMTQETGNSSTKAEKCFIKIIEFIEQNSPNALHGTEETQENEDGNNVVVSKSNELDLEIYYIDADTLQYCINECEKCIGKNKSANIVAEGMNNVSMSPRARKN